MILPFNDKISILSEFYSKITESREITESINKGVLVKGSIKHLSQIFSNLLDEKILSSGQLFLDTGSGDGRICALASIFGLKSFGIELNPIVSKLSLECIDQLERLNIFTDNNKPKIIKGDFFDKESYLKLGTLFESFEIIFNYVTYQNELADKIASESKSGTIFILHSPTPHQFTFRDMIYVKKIPLNKIYQEIYVFKKE